MGDQALRWTLPHTFFWKARRSPSLSIPVLRRFFPGGVTMAQTVMKMTQATFDRAKKLLLVLQEHNKSVLAHAQRKRVGTIQDFKQPGANGVELDDVNH
jgi:hypothetical protein